MYSDNNWYGHRFILSEYCGVKDSPCFAIIQHGWPKSTRDFVGNYKAPKVKQTPFLCWNERSYNGLKNNKIDNCKIIGSPFLYLEKIIDKQKSEPRGTMLFPAHSAPQTDKFMYSDRYLKDAELIQKKPGLIQKVNHDAIIEEIEKISPPPYTVCLYFADFNNENRKPYINKGWKVICMGNRASNNFLYNFYNEVSAVENVICTDLNSAVFYSLYLKKKVKVMYKIKNILINSIENDYNDFFKDLYYENYKDLYDNFLFGQKGLDLAKKELGFNFIKNKEELKKILGWNSILKKNLAKFFSFLIDIKYGKKIRN